jgi:hypothetical protein
MTKKLLQLNGLKWNPFEPDVPTEALLARPRIDNLGWRVEHLAPRAPSPRTSAPTC